MYRLIFALQQLFIYGKNVLTDDVAPMMTKMESQGSYEGFQVQNQKTQGNDVMLIIEQKP